MVLAVPVVVVAPRVSAAPANVGLPPPKAWVLVDAGSGAVLDASNDRQPLPPASLTKLLTAVVGAQTLQPTDALTVSARAAGEPARKIGMKPGEVWTFRDALYCLLLSSANDAAAAIGERIGSTLENFAVMMADAGTQLGLADRPLLQDPAGLDDNFSVAGGNLLSARDIAIIARAALAQPEVATVVGTDRYAFIGPDGVHHRLTNHIHSFLTTYPGAVGLKPGFTRKAGSGLVLAARRAGRTLISVVLDAPSAQASATALLDTGFALPPGTLGTGDVLPRINEPAPAGTPHPPASNPTVPPAPAIPTVRYASSHHARSAGVATVIALVIGALLIAFIGRRRQVRRQRRRRLARRHNLPPGVTALHHPGPRAERSDEQRRAAQR